MKKTALALLMIGIVFAGATSSVSALQQNLTLQPLATVNQQAANVPEPATMFLFGTGLIGLSVLFRRKGS